MKTFTLEGFAHFLLDAGMAANIEHAERSALEWAARAIEREAKDAIGTYRYDWPPLQPETIAKKTTGDSPLLETGEMRDSIEHIVIGHTEAHVGSNNDKALWHELGTKTIPPRSFLGEAARRCEPAIREVAKIAVGAAVASRSIEAEILRLAGHAIREVGHTAREMVEDTDNEQHQKH